MPVPDNVAKDVLKQVEFYFSDSNLPRDKFLLELVQDEANPEHWVDLKIVVAFARMRALLQIKDIEPDNVPEEKVEDVANVLKTSDALVVSEDGKKIRRKEPLGSLNEALKAADARTLYVSPFPYTATLEAMTDFFSQHGEVRCVRMRRHQLTKDFRGSIFLELDSVETANKVKEMELEFEGAPLKMVPKVDFKEEVIDIRHSRPNSTFNKQSGGRKEESEDDSPIEYDLGLIVHFKFKDDVDAEMTREVVQEALGGEAAGITFVKYSRGLPDGWLRFTTAQAADALLAEIGEAKEKELVEGKVAVFTKLEGEAEEKYWKEVRQSQRDFKARRGGRGGRGGFRGGGGRGPKRHKSGT